MWAPHPLERWKQMHSFAIQLRPKTAGYSSGRQTRDPLEEIVMSPAWPCPDRPMKASMRPSLSSGPSTVPWLRRATACALLLSLVAPVRVCLAQAQAFRYTVPAGWTESNQFGAIALAPVQDAQGVSLMLYPPLLQAADVSGEFNALKGVTENSYNLRDGVVDFPVAQTMVDGAPLYITMGHYQSNQGPIFLLVAGRAERGAFALMTYMAGSAQLFQKYLQPAMGLIGGVRLTEAASGMAAASAAAANAAAGRAPGASTPPSSVGAAPAAALNIATVSRPPSEPPPRIPPGDMATPSFTWGTVPPPAGNAGLDGMYRYLGFNEDVVAYGVRSNVTWQYWTFLPDGRFFSRLPDEGLENFNLDYFRAIVPANCGTYVLNGSKGVVHDDAYHTTRPIELGAKGLYIDGVGPYIRVDRLNGWKPAGTYRVSDWQSNPNHANIYFRFTAAGEFEERGAMALLGHWDRKGQYNLTEDWPDAATRMGRGTYDIRNNSLTLIYNDGRRRRINIAKSPRVEAGEVFIINIWGFVRVG
jgi:hypothetical protein